MRKQSKLQGPKSKAEKWPGLMAFGFWLLHLGPVRGSLIVFLLALLAVTGCDLFDPSAKNDPVFGPPPPRSRLLATKAGTSPAPTTQTADSTATAAGATSATAPGAAPAAGPAAAATGSGDWGDAVQASSATTRGSAPSDDAIKTTSFSSHAPPKTRMSGNEVAALVNGQPIFASEIFERAFPEPLPPEGMSLLAASKNIANGRVSEQELRALQETAIKRYLKDYIRTRILSQALEAKLEKEQKDKIEEAIGKMFDEYVEKLKKDLKASARHEVEAKLRLQGTSLASLKVEFRYRLLADEYVRQKSKKPHVVGRREVLDYYEAHLADYSYPERVRWQLLEISFAKHGGQQKALSVLEKAIDALRRGEDFGAVAKKFSDGPRAENGGQQSWMKPSSIADEKTAAMLLKLAPGEVSGVVHGEDSYRLLRVNARKPAGRNTLAEVQDTIKRKIEDKLQKDAVREVLLDVYQHASIESSFLPPEELGPPADVAVAPAPAKTENNSSKKRHDRS